jgi:hypothetical protein
MKLQIARWINKLLGDDWGGSASPPGMLAELDFGEPEDDGRPMHVARTYCNDGAELWLGYHWKWLAHYDARDARRLAWFILWTWWAKGTWFGLKRWIWYKALHVIVESYNG